MFEFLIQHSSSALLVAVLVLAAAACATHYKPHPGAINIARDAWLTYRGALATNTPSDQYLQQLTRNLTDLTGALESLKRREVKP